MYQSAVDVFRSRQSFLLTTHIMPDGDGLGSIAALRAGLVRMGKSVRVVLPSAVSHQFDFLDPQGTFEHYAEGSSPDSLRGVEVAVMLDAGHWERLGRLGEALRSLEGVSTICIDHHQGNEDPADINILDPEAPATGLMIYEILVEEMGLELDRDMALGMYVAFVTETGGFRYSNTTSKLHVLAARFLELGVEPSVVNTALNERNSEAALRLTARALGSLGRSENGAVAWLSLGPEDFAETGATEHDTGRLVSYPRALDGVELAIMLFEDIPGSTKVSFRSKTHFDVSLFAARFGGGGHQRAAGALVEGTLEQVRERVVAAALEALG